MPDNIGLTDLFCRYLTFLNIDIGFKKVISIDFWLTPFNEFCNANVLEIIFPLFTSNIA